MFTIVKYPNEILDEEMPKFDFSNPLVDPKHLETEMLECMYQHNGVGLSANQVGIKTSVFVMGDKSFPELGKAFFNPEIIYAESQLLDIEEGCLSFPNMFIKVKRPSKIMARWQNYKGEWETGEFENFECKCFCHEFDHLQGIVFKDRVSSLKWSLSFKKSQKRKGK